VSDTAASSRTDRVDFRATSDPALLESADRGEANLLTYRALYSLWERQHWAVVQPLKIIGQINMERFSKDYGRQGVNARLFSDPDAAMRWLDAQ